MDPRIDSYMTALPLAATPDVPVSKAVALLEDYPFRHIPVKQGDEILGVVSDRELRVACLYPGPGELTLGDLVSGPPYVVAPDTPLFDVVHEMAEHRRDCVLVKDEHGHLVGIFTTIDALRAFRELLGELARQASVA